MEGDRLREEDAAKKEGKRQREAAKAVRRAWGASGGQGASGRMGRRGGAAIGTCKEVCYKADAS